MLPDAWREVADGFIIAIRQHVARAVGGISGRLDQVEIQQSELARRLDEVAVRLDALADEMAALAGELTALREQVSALQGEA